MVKRDRSDRDREWGVLGSESETAEVAVRRGSQVRRVVVITLEDGDGVDRGSGTSEDNEWGDGEHEFVAVVFFADLREALEVGVVQKGHPHVGDGNFVEGDAGGKVFLTSGFLEVPTEECCIGFVEIFEDGDGDAGCVGRDADELMVRVGGVEGVCT